MVSKRMHLKELEDRIYVACCINPTVILILVTNMIGS